MARQVITKLIDDLDGGEADQTVEFALDGVSYTVDLSDKNALALRDALAPFVAVGTRIGRSGGGVTRAIRGAAAAAQRNTRAENQEIREWAAANGYEISERGRIPVDVVEAFRNRDSKPAKKAAGKK
ncbi:Lsr2 family protein [Micromonospora andamanensis]|uniref:histone-like nucleoid-structuring protein Lsr2 n=1 Tax=Micromonospora andamanensis TaxID=1287068 RepID=UPI001951DFB5|nr:Lsr2 family protein [Micromonospora andamanensis]GIJ38504.1 Lsr2 family protein [Micromonospora andamanensis]